MLVRKTQERLKQRDCPYNMFCNGCSRRNGTLQQMTPPAKLKTATDYFSIYKSSTGPIKNRKLNKRSKRANGPEHPVFVETAVFVDKDLFDHMKSNFPTDTERELIRFVLAMINAVSNKQEASELFTSL